MMLTSKDIKEKLFRSAEGFNYHIREKHWLQAKHVYDTAVNVSVFVGLDEADMIKLFGSRAYNDTQPPTAGLFAESKVQKAYFECSVKRDMPRESNYPLEGIKKCS